MNMQRGFSAVEGLLIVIVISAIGFAGWYVVGNSDENESTQNNNQSSEDTAQQNDIAEEEDTTFNCADEFTFDVPEQGWYPGVIENGLNCFAATQKVLPAQGGLTGDDLSMVFTAEKDLTVKVDKWADEFFDSSQGGDYPIVNTSKERITLDNGEPAVLATGDGGHSNGSKNTYFFYVKDGTLGISTAWDSSTSEQALRDDALTIVKSIK